MGKSLMRLLEKKIKIFLVKQLKPQTIYLFGSYVKGNFNINSDIDIAVLLNKKVNKFCLFDTACELGAIIDRDVDLVDFEDVPLTLRFQILKNKKIIYCQDNEQRLYYEMMALSKYQKLNDEREIVLNAKLGDGIWTLL